MRGAWAIGWALWLGACGDPKEDGTDETDAADDTDVADDEGVGTVQLTLAEFLSREPIEGADITAAGASYTSDAAGEATLEIAPDARFETVIEATGFPLHRWEDGPVTAGMNQATARLLVSDTTLATLGGALGVPVDDTKGLVIVQLTRATVASDGSGFDSTGALVGGSVSLSASSTVSLVEDASPIGLTMGDTVGLASGSGIVVFVNVDPGEVTVTYTPPGGETCGASFGVLTDTAFDDITVGAGEVTAVVYYCY